MSKRTTYLLGIVVTIITGTFLYLNFCCNYCRKKNENLATIVLKTQTDLWFNRFLVNGNDFQYQCDDNFRFIKNGSENLIPVSDSIQIGLNKLKFLFDKNPNQKLLITGFATTDEKNTSAYPNLGEARANSIKNYFVSRGFSTTQFDCKGELRDKWLLSGDTLLGPANFKIFMVEADAPQIDWNSVKEKINANPLILYFNSNQTEIRLTIQERQKISDIVHYLDNVPNSKLNVIGHTDNIGDRILNTKLGLNRANFVKDYLVKNEVIASKIKGSSKGPDEPIANNNTVAGKSKNRRTVITIQ